MEYQKRKRESKSSAKGLDIANKIDTSKPSASFKPLVEGREWTLSVALPGSVVANAKSHDAKTRLAGTIARALAVFCVDEIVLFDDGNEGIEAKTPPASKDTYTAYSHPSHFLAHLLSFLETPPYLRKALFPTHPNLKTAGALPSLDMPHHLRQDEFLPFREGVTIGLQSGYGTIADVGIGEEIFINNEFIPPGTRTTLAVGLSLEGTPVDAAIPREEMGYYWGYTIRQCGSLSNVLTECPFDGGYDLSIGMSERGQTMDTVLNNQKELPVFNHLLIVLGGVAGLETAASNDPELKEKGIGKAQVSQLFDFWVNILPGQGSRTIRTEEALWLGLMATQPIIRQRYSQ